VRWGQEGLGGARGPLTARSRKDVHPDPYPEAVAHARAGRPSNVRARASTLDFGPGTVKLSRPDIIFSFKFYSLR
jgi:hypothetical protein